MCVVCVCGFVYIYVCEGVWYVMCVCVCTYMYTRWIVFTTLLIEIHPLLLPITTSLSSPSPPPSESYNKLRTDLVRLSSQCGALHTTFLRLSGTYPLLTLHYICMRLIVGPPEAQWIVALLTAPEPQCVLHQLTTEDNLDLLCSHCCLHLLPIISRAACQAACEVL